MGTVLLSASAMVQWALAGQGGNSAAGDVLFQDDFESGLAGWDLSDAEAITLFKTEDPKHGYVLRLAPAGARLHALIRGSESWPAYRIEGDVLFPDDDHNYLGFVYNLTETPERVDLGSIYIKGNGSYIRVNPRRDWNPSRALYEEFHVPLTGTDAIVIGRWQHFAAEVIGRACHFYVGDMRTPKVTFDFLEVERGKVGFKPRVVGTPVWIDNISARSIEAFSYQGPPRPLGVHYAPESMVTDWQVLGPLTRTYRRNRKGRPFVRPGAPRCRSRQTLATPRHRSPRSRRYGTDHGVPGESHRGLFCQRRSKCPEVRRQNCSSARSTTWPSGSTVHSMATGGGIALPGTTSGGILTTGRPELCPWPRERIVC